MPNNSTVYGKTPVRDWKSLRNAQKGRRVRRGKKERERSRKIFAKIVYCESIGTSNRPFGKRRAPADAASKARPRRSAVGSRHHHRNAFDERIPFPDGNAKLGRASFPCPQPGIKKRKYFQYAEKRREEKRNPIQRAVSIAARSSGTRWFFDMSPWFSV